jgi:predicted DNA-binding transcriptional regulator YafY
MSYEKRPGGIARFFRSLLGIGGGSEVENAVRSAFDVHTVLEVRYKNSRGTQSDRFFKIYGIGYRYIDAYDTKRGAVRTFKLDRIIWVRRTDDKYSVPDEYDSSDWVATGTGVVI